MDSYNFIESGLVLSVGGRQDLLRVPFSPGDFSLHGQAFGYLQEHFDEFGKFPTADLLSQKFPDLDRTASDLSFDYCLAEFRKQVLVRRATSTIKAAGRVLKDDPVKAISDIISGLDDLSLDVSTEDVFLYDSGSVARLEEYRRRKEIRGKLKMIGIPTPIKSLNRAGVGWIEGDLISLFARPTVGKTWISLKIAATAMKRGYRVLFVSPEMTSSSIELRMDVILAQMHGYDFSHSALVKGDFIDESKYEEFLKGNNSRALLTCDHMDKGGITLSGIQGKARKHKPDILIVDGIQLVSGGKGRDSVWERMQELFYGLKSLATSQKLVCVASTQANRGASDIFSPPGPEHVAFGDALIQASDVAFSMCKVEADEKLRLVQLQKYRNAAAPFWQVTMDWDVDRGKIEERKEDE